MNLEQCWFGNRECLDHKGTAANDSLLSEDALLNKIIQRLEQELPQRPYMEQGDLANIIGVTAKTLANRRAMYHSKYPAPIYFGGSKKPLFSRVDVLNWLAREEYLAKTIHRYKCA